MQLEGHSWVRDEVFVAVHWDFVASPGVIGRVTAVFGSQLWWCLQRIMNESIGWTVPAGWLQALTPWEPISFLTVLPSSLGQFYKWSLDERNLCRLGLGGKWQDIELKRLSKMRSQGWTGDQ